MAADRLLKIDVAAVVGRGRHTRVVYDGKERHRSGVEGWPILSTDPFVLFCALSDGAVHADAAFDAINESWTS